MTTTREKTLALTITRILIFLLGVTSILVDSPLSDVLAIISLAAWLWMPSLIGYELKILDKYHKWRNK